jgi:ribosomal protein S27E
MWDGNAIAGTLKVIFGHDMTVAAATCAGCGATAPLAESAVYLRAPGIVVRCRNCDTVLAVVVERRAVYCADFRGLFRFAGECASRGI